MPTSTTTSTPLRILLVGDDSSETHRVEAELSGDGPFSVERVDDLDRVLERPNGMGADLLLLQVGPSDRDPLAGLRRAHEEFSQLPIVVLVDGDDEGIALEAIRSGAQECVLKSRPDEPPLGRTVRHAVERKWAENARNVHDAMERDEATKWIRRLSMAVDQGPASAIITDRSGRIEYVNARFTEITGYRQEEVLGRTPRVLQSGETPPEVYRELWRTITSGAEWQREILNRRKDGSLYWDRVRISPIRDAQGHITHFLGLQEDISERKDAEEALRSSEERLRTLFETVNLIVLVLDVKGRVEYVNPFFLELTGHTLDEVVGEHWVERFIPEADRPDRVATFEEVLREEAHPHFRNTILTADGEERMVSWHNTVLRDADDRPIGTLSVGEDITATARLEEQLRQAQKMEAVGLLAGGIAHDFNNLLTAILGPAELALLDVDPDDPVHRDLTDIKAAAGRAAGLTRQLLAFSRRQVLEPRLIDVSGLVSDVERLLTRVIGEDIDLRIAVEPGIGTVLADPGQLEQVILNLVVNARDAMPTGGTLTIETSEDVLGEVDVAGPDPIAPGGYVVITVSDTGTGMDETTRGRIFEPFFTTKPKGRGTGLGLSTVYGIVQQSGGRVSVESEPGDGTTFRIYLPVVDEEPEGKTGMGWDPESLAGTETVLVVEDDAVVRSVVEKMLEVKGYRVLSAASGEEALETARRHPDRIDLLVTDLIMPDMSGRALADELRESSPATKVLYVSGHSDETILPHGGTPRVPTYLQKPFTPDQLALEVRRVLESEEA